MRSRRSPAIIAWIVPVLILAIQCRADAPTSEYRVKAAFIYNFTQFIEWPDSAFTGPGSPFVVATVGNDPFQGALENSMGGKSVLTIGETDAFCPSGGAIQFFIENDHMRFEINRDATDAAGLKVSAKLMSLARIYKK